MAPAKASGRLCIALPSQAKHSSSAEQRNPYGALDQTSGQAVQACYRESRRVVDRSARVRSRDCEAAYASPQQRTPRSAPFKPRASARTPSVMAEPTAIASGR